MHVSTSFQELKDENSRLFKLLGERDYEIRQLKKKREEDKIALTGRTQCVLLLLELGCKQTCVIGNVGDVIVGSNVYDTI